MTARRIAVLLSLVLALACVPSIVWAAAAPPAATPLTLDLTGGGVMTERLMQIVGLITVLSLAPSILIMMTCFTRIVVVLSLLRTAMGVQSSPPNSVIVSLALFLTFFVMAPTFTAIYDNALQPMIDQKIDTMEAFNRASDPIKKFMSQHTRAEDLQLFITMAKAAPPTSIAAAPLQALVPAFMLSELKRAFEIGFLIFVPFLVIDMAVASARGQHEAAHMAIMHALEINPVSIITLVWAGVTSHLARQFDDAIRHYQSALELDPQFIWAHMYMAQALEQKGNLEEALREFETTIRLAGGNNCVKAMKAHAHAVAGDTCSAREILNELTSAPSPQCMPSYDIAATYAALGDSQQVVAWLNRACNERNMKLFTLTQDPRFDPLRRRSDFKQIVDQMGLGQVSPARGQN